MFPSFCFIHLFRQPNTGLTALCSYYVLTIKFDFVLYSFFANILELVMVEGLLLIKLETLCSHSIQSNFLKNKLPFCYKRPLHYLLALKWMKNGIIQLHVNIFDMKYPNFLKTHLQRHSETTICDTGLSQTIISLRFGPSVICWY